MRQRRPPKRMCTVCGGDYYGWAERGACPKCFAETAVEAADLTALIRESRQLRLGLDPSLLESCVPSVGLGRVFEATGDDIPY